uniref:Uncharacterized protein n=1 Tax=Cacopsylla melanoneura TaxID=428564 RepID=A0A8D8X317_9HEMI
MSLPTSTPFNGNASTSAPTNSTPKKARSKCSNGATNVASNSANVTPDLSLPTDSTPKKTRSKCSNSASNSAIVTPDLPPSSDGTKNSVTPPNSTSSLASGKQSAQKRLRTPRGPGKSSINKLSAKALANSNGLQLQMTVENLTNKIRTGQKFVPIAANQNQLECHSSKKAAKH